MANIAIFLYICVWIGLGEDPLCAGISSNCMEKVLSCLKQLILLSCP